MAKVLDKHIGVPSNIITGFLGVGKTSTILHLLKSKPTDERWAVLVNEFGEVGIDGYLFNGKYSQEQGVYMREVQGGCMGCTTEFQMRQELEQLLKHAKPHRLLIEPTGLGHPKEVLDTLKGERFCGVLAIQKIITIVDARHLFNIRYLHSEAFNQQISIADTLVANKQDLCSENDKARLNTYLQVNHLDEVKLVYTEQGMIDPKLLDGPTGTITESSNACHSPQKKEIHPYQDAPIPKCGFIKTVNQNEGYVTIGWRFSSKIAFNRQRLFTFLNSINAQRLKATFITSSGNFAYNLARDALSEIAYERFHESRIEIIAWLPCKKWEQQLFECMDVRTITPQVDAS